MDSPLVSVIVVNFKDESNIEACLKSVLCSNYPNLEVLVIDCLTNDDFIQSISQKFPKVQVYHFKEDLGIDKSCNVGSSLSNGKYVVILDNDVVVDRNWLNEPIALMEKEEKIAVIQPKLLLYNEQNILDGAGDSIDRFGFSKVTGQFGRDNKEYSKIRAIFSPRGACIIVCRDVYISIEGRDEDFLVTYGDVDLGWRVWLMGFKVVFMPFSRVHHKVGRITKEISPRMIYHEVKNRYMMIMKNFNLSNLFRAYCFNIFYDFFLALSYIKKRKLSLLKAIISGHLYVLANLDKILHKRQKTQKSRCVSDYTLFQDNIIVKRSFVIDRRFNVERK